MSLTQIRRCHISCRAQPAIIFDIVESGKIVSSRGSIIEIGGMLVAYNYKTREARIYAEFKDKIRESVIESYMIDMKATSVRVDSFSSSDWVSASQIAFQSVLQCSEVGRDVGIMRYGTLAVENDVQPSANDASNEGMDTDICVVCLYLLFH